MKYNRKSEPIWICIVAPHAGVWIEISVSFDLGLHISVAPHAGVWIEIQQSVQGCHTWKVARHAGVWIEILCLPFPDWMKKVARHAGAWIEMRNGKLVTLWGQRGDLLTEV